jgi:hypothetical protein
MPFVETCRMEERVSMLAEYDTGIFGVSDLCRRYGVSRDCGTRRIPQFVDHQPGPKCRESPRLNSAQTSPPTPLPIARRETGVLPNALWRGESRLRRRRSWTSASEPGGPGTCRS